MKNKYYCRLCYSNCDLDRSLFITSSVGDPVSVCEKCYTSCMMNQNPIPNSTLTVTELIDAYMYHLGSIVDLAYEDISRRLLNTPNN